MHFKKNLNSPVILHPCFRQELSPVLHTVVAQPHVSPPAGFCCGDDQCHGAKHGAGCSDAAAVWGSTQMLFPVCFEWQIWGFIRFIQGYALTLHFHAIPISLALGIEPRNTVSE